MVYDAVKMAGVFFICLSLFGGMLQATGVDTHLGINNPGNTAEDSVNDARDNASSFDTGAPTGETLFGAYNVLSNTLASILGVFNPGLVMLYNAGVPAYIVGGPNTIGFLPPIATILQGLAVIEFFRGFSG